MAPASKLTLLSVLALTAVLIYLLPRLSTVAEYFTHDAGKKTIVLYYLPGCGHCHRMMPEWNKFAKKHKGHPRITARKINCEKNPKKAQEHGIEGYPTILLFKDGKKHVFSGERTARAFEHFARNL